MTPTEKKEIMTHVPRAACAKCGLQMQASVGQKVLVTSGHGSYYLISADMYTCPECGAEVLAAWAQQPYAQVHNANFETQECSADVVIDLEPTQFRTPYHIRRAHRRRKP